MSTAYLLAFLMFILFLFFGIAATLLLPDHEVTLVDPVTTEADERLATTEDMVAIRLEFDRMLVGKGLVTNGQLRLDPSRHQIPCCRHGHAADRPYPRGLS